MDVDSIAEISSYVEHVRFGQRLRDIGFAEDTSEGAPLCRWRQGEVILDVMPLDETILGFSNRWYREAMYAAEVLTLEPLLNVRRITAPLFLATKLEAFKGRGAGDYYSSHDLEDVLSVIDGRPELLEEARCASDDVRTYLALEFSSLLRDTGFIDALPGHLPPDEASQARIPMLHERLQTLARR